MILVGVTLGFLVWICNSPVLVVSSFSVISSSPSHRRHTGVAFPMSSSALASSTKPEIEVIRQPDAEFLKQKGVFDWGTWGCDAGSFPWTYGENESAYLLAGKVTVTPTDGRQAATFEKGDFVTFPAGMSCTWDVQEAVHKHFMFF